MPSTDDRLIQRVRAGEPDAWSELIERFEGRLLAFAVARLRDRAASEDVVQETFVGFLTSLPNFDGRRPLESYLFSIAAHKLTDHLRRRGRRPTLPLAPTGESSGTWNVPSRQRGPSTAARSDERRMLEAHAVADALAELIGRWRERQEWEKLACAELLLVRGLPNKEVARLLAVSEQTVANQKFDVLSRLRSLLARQSLSPDVFPELSAT